MPTEKVKPTRTSTNAIPTEKVISCGSDGSLNKSESDTSVKVLAHLNLQMLT